MSARKGYPVTRVLLWYEQRTWLVVLMYLLAAVLAIMVGVPR